MICPSRLPAALFPSISRFFSRYYYSPNPTAFANFGVPTSLSDAILLGSLEVLDSETPGRRGSATTSSTPKERGSSIFTFQVISYFITSCPSVSLDHGPFVSSVPQLGRNDTTGRYNYGSRVP